jgi:tRNA A37 N6-isopentenylltransferase MiaA
MNISQELKLLFENDQKDRAGKYDEIYVEKMQTNDKARLKRAREIYKWFENNNIELLNDDFFYLAMLFQHSSSIKDYKILG